MRIAKRLRVETTMTLAWVVQQIDLGAPAHAANCRREQK